MKWFLLILLVLSSCGPLNRNRWQEKQNFYTSDGSWDYSRIPLIKPFQLMLNNGDSLWVLNSSKSKNYSGDIASIDKVNIVDSTIIGHSKRYLDKEDPEFNSREKWFALIVKKNELKTFYTKEEFREWAIKHLKSDSLFDVEMVSKNLKNNYH